MQQKQDKIDQLAKKLHALLPMRPEWQAQLDKKFRLEFNYNSNHMEGNTLTYSETELLLFFDETKGSHTLREYEEMKAHDVALRMVKEWADDKERPLTESNIKNLNEAILVKPFWKDAITPDGQPTRRLIKVGDYKEYPNSVRLSNGEIFDYASVTDTPIKMGELMDWYRAEEKTLHPATLAAMLHYKFVRIHPFDDGNGRIARLLMNYVLFKNNLPPVVIKSTDKVNYLRALRVADTGEYEPLIQYVAEQMIWSLELSLKAAQGESIEEPEDLDKKLQVLEQELEAIDPNEEVKMHFSLDTFEKIYDNWLSLLIAEAVPVIQKFNKFFSGTQHYISLPSGLGSSKFVNESANEVLQQLSANKSTQGFQDWQGEATIRTHYGTLTKGGLKTFGCNYSIVVKFDTIKYEVSIDTFTGHEQPSREKMYERLLHKPLTQSERKRVIDMLAMAIYTHIDEHTKKNGLR